MNYIMSVAIIKTLLKQELAKFYSHSLNALNYYGTLSDVPREMIHSSYRNFKEKLENCISYDHLEQYISDVGYRMNLSEWIDSYDHALD